MLHNNLFKKKKSKGTDFQRLMRVVLYVVKIKEFTSCISGALGLVRSLPQAESRDPSICIFSPIHLHRLVSETTLFICSDISLGPNWRLLEKQKK